MVKLDGLFKVMMVMGLFFGLGLSSTSNATTHGQSIYRVGIYIGFMDQVDTVRMPNFLVRQMISAHLLSPCKTPRQIFCQMKSESQDFKEIFKRQLGSYLYQVEVLNSAYTNRLDLNFGSNKSEQIELSQYVQTEFETANRSFDKSIYIGHSRFGGGPDFRLPVYPRGNNGGPQEVDKNYYRKNRPGLLSLVQSISKRSESTPLRLGLFSCDSSTHFLEDLDSLRSKVIVQGTKSPMTVQEATLSALQFIEL